VTEYRLAAARQGSAEQGIQVVVLEIDETTDRMWRIALKELTYFEQRDIEYVERAYKAVQAASRPYRGNKRLIESSAVIELTGSTMDWLGAMRTYLAHIERKLSGTDDAPGFRSRCVNAYDGCFAYRFLYRLRNYAQHYALPLHKAVALDQGWRLCVDRDALLEQYDGWSAVGDEIRHGEPEIDILPLIAEAMEALRAVDKPLLEKDQRTATDAADCVRQIRAHFEAHHFGAMLVDCPWPIPKVGDEITIRAPWAWRDLEGQLLKLGTTFDLEAKPLRRASVD
jgi:hypothetical protein